jgi:hypothetical protein
MAECHEAGRGASEEKLGATGGVPGGAGGPGVVIGLEEMEAEAVFENAEVRRYILVATAHA